MTVPPLGAALSCATALVAMSLPLLARRYLLPVAVLLASTAASAQSPGPLAEARAALAAGDSGRAHGLVRDASRRGADDAAVWRLRLRLELAGVGQTMLARWMRQEQALDVARGLLRRAPADTLALRVLTQDALWTALTYDDRAVRVELPSLSGGPPSRDVFQVRPPGRSNGVPSRQTIGYTESSSADAAEVRGMLKESRFDIRRREVVLPSFDQSGVSRDAQARALGYIEAWLAADPSSPRAYAAALALATLTERWDGARLVARAFQVASLDPRADLYAGLASFRLGDAEIAEALFERGLARMSAAERGRVESIAALLKTEHQDDYAADRQRVGALFWTQTDARLLTEVNERRAEHYARVIEADLLFGPSASDLFETDPPRGAETQQGQVWIRYGRPLRSITYAPGAAETSAIAVWEYPDFRYVFYDQWRSGVYTLYSPTAEAFGSGDPSVYNDDYVIQDRVMRRDDPQRTQDLPETAIDLSLLTSRFRVPGGGTEVVVAFGLPADVARPVTAGVFTLWAGSVRDRTVDRHASLDASRVVGRGAEAVWTDAKTVQLPASGRVQVEVEAPGGQARGLAVEAVEPLADDAGGLAVSDLLLATSIDDDGDGLVVRGGLGIVPAARAVFATADPIYVYLEAYGLGLEDGRSRYTVEATLTPEARRGGLAGRIFGRGQGPGVSVETEAEGTRSTDAVSFFVDVRDQPPGAYTLRVEVADAVTGQTAAAERGVVLE